MDDAGTREMSFATQLSAGIREIERDANKLWKEAVAISFRNVILNTPRDTGQAQGSWVVGSNNDGQIPTKTAPELSFDGKIPDIGGTVLLYSNLPYIERLEDGYSQQAPQGMVKTVEAQWPALIKRRSNL